MGCDVERSSGPSVRVEEYSVLDTPTWTVRLTRVTTD